MLVTVGESLKQNGNLGALAFVWRRFLRIVASILVVVGLFLAWRTFMPRQMGGSSTYVMVSGSSMLPHFRPGDAVILKTEPTYSVGEVIAYYNPQLHIKVMHRIYSTDNGHFLMKGDNNDFIDSYHPTISNVVGAEWVHIAGAGWILYDLRQPPVAAGFAGIAGLLIVTSRKRLKRRRYRIETQSKF